MVSNTASKLFPLRARAAREALFPKMSQRAAAARLGLSPSAINLWEMGKTEPSLDKLTEMSRLYNVSVEWLLGIESARATHIPGESIESAAAVNLVPVVSPRDLARWKVSEAKEFFQTLLIYPAQTAAAFAVTSDALSSTCPPGSTAVISKGHAPTPGHVVLAVVGQSEEPVLRKFIREGDEDLLVADDTRFTTHKVGKSVKILGVVTETALRKPLI